MKSISYKTFRKFLRDNDCERQFDNAFYAQCGANVLDETLADILVIDEPFFNRCFDWSKTAEGRQFWKNLDDKWWTLCEGLEETVLPARKKTNPQDPCPEYVILTPPVDYPRKKVRQSTTTTDICSE